MFSVMDDSLCRNASELHEVYQYLDGGEFEIVVKWRIANTSEQRAFVYEPFHFLASEENKFQYIIQIRKLVLRMRRNVEWENVNMYITWGIYVLF